MGNLQPRWENGCDNYILDPPALGTGHVEAHLAATKASIPGWGREAREPRWQDRPAVRTDRAVPSLSTLGHGCREAHWPAVVAAAQRSLPGPEPRWHDRPDGQPARQGPFP